MLKALKSLLGKDTYFYRGCQKKVAFFCVMPTRVSFVGNGDEMQYARDRKYVLRFLRKLTIADTKYLNEPKDEH